jgi:hypothetical protein
VRLLHSEQELAVEKTNKDAELVETDLRRGSAGLQEIMRAGAQDRQFSEFFFLINDVVSVYHAFILKTVIILKFYIPVYYKDKHLWHA